jgi:hypothetical protein
MHTYIHTHTHIHRYKHTYIHRKKVGEYLPPLTADNPSLVQFIQSQVCVCMHVCSQVCMCMHVCFQVCVCMHVYFQVCMCMRVCMYAGMCVVSPVFKNYICMHGDIYIHTLRRACR